MLRPRIIACLLVHDGGLVKTVQFAAPKYVGHPMNAVNIFNEKEADELIVLDIDATVTGAEPNFRLIAENVDSTFGRLWYAGRNSSRLNWKKWNRRFHVADFDVPTEQPSILAISSCS